MPFRWPKVENDISLVKEVIGQKPETPDEWDEIAKTLSEVFGPEVTLKGRGCREHFELLSKKYKSEDKKSLKRSGTEEDYTELAQMLEDITCYYEDKKCQIAVLKANKKKKEDCDKLKGIQMRKAAMETHSKRKLKQTSPSQDENDCSDEDEGLQTPKKACATGRLSTPQLLNFLVEKQESSHKLKEKKLELEERKLSIEEQRIALEDKKWNVMMADKS